MTTWQYWNQLLRGWENKNTAEQASAWQDIKAGWHEAPVANWSAVKRWQHPRIWTSSGPQGKIGCSTSHPYLLKFLPCCHAMGSPVSSALDQRSRLQKVSHRHKRKGWGKKTSVQLDAALTYGSCWQTVLVPLVMQDFCLMWLGQESQDPCCQSTQVNEYELGHCHYKKECLKEGLQCNKKVTQILKYCI